MEVFEGKDKMELKQETVKQIRGLIIFTAVLIVCLWKFDVVISAFQFVLNIVYPFLLGGAIAFALSVPMNFVERKLFTERKISEKYKRKYARGISLMLVIAGVTGIRGNDNIRAASAIGRNICQSGKEYSGVYPAGAGVQITGSIIIKKL